MESTKLKKINGITSVTYYHSGEREEVRVNQYNIVETQYGKLIPFYEDLGIRRKDKASLTFYENGSLKNISLNEQTVVETIIGKVPAEFLTFYESGALNSLFIMDGKLSFSWSEEEEKLLFDKTTFQIQGKEYSVRLIGIRFYESGAIRSIILWPGEIMELELSIGCVSVRKGIKFYEDGKIQSIEPAFKTEVITPVGTLKAYDSNAIGGDADINSLVFNRDGTISSLATVGTVSIKNLKQESLEMIVPRLRIGLMDDEFNPVPLIYQFSQDKVTIFDGIKVREWNLSEIHMSIEYKEEEEICSCYGNCSACQGCS